MKALAVYFGAILREFVVIAGSREKFVCELVKYLLLFLFLCSCGKKTSVCSENEPHLFFGETTIWKVRFSKVQWNVPTTGICIQNVKFLICKCHWTVKVVTKLWLWCWWKKIYSIILTKLKILLARASESDDL